MQEGVHNDMLVLGFGLGIVKLNESSDQFRPIDIFFGTVEYWDANSSYMHGVEAILVTWLTVVTGFLSALKHHGTAPNKMLQGC